MADRLYLRHSTDKQTDAWQRQALAKLIEGGAPVYEDPATSSRVLSLNRPGFKQLLEEAAVDDTVRIADAARLFRSVADVLALRPVLIRRGLHLKVESGLLSGIDLAADGPGTKMVVSVLAAVLEFQRDMISENTKKGVAAAEAAGKNLGRSAAFDEGETIEIVKAYREGAPVKALARQYGVDPKTIRRALDSAGPARSPTTSGSSWTTRSTVRTRSRLPSTRPWPSTSPACLPSTSRPSTTPVSATLCRAGGPSAAGRVYSLRVTAPLTLHQAVLEQCAALVGDVSTPAGGKAHRAYAERIAAARAE